MERNISYPHYLTSEKFYDLVKEKLPTGTIEGFALISVDFDNFNFINDLFSYEIGDKVLDKITKYFSDNLNDGEFFSNMHDDHFAFWAKHPVNGSLVQRFSKLAEMKSVLSDLLPEHYNLICSGGIVYVRDINENLPSLFDKANFARKQAKRNHAATFLHYDKKMEEELQWRKIITFMMEAALQSNEFQMYLQPKVLIKTGQIIGAEALARWKSPQHGMIYPDRFIPILEQNGFIKQLDFFILEQACLFLRYLQTQGLPVLPISVNFSKTHIRSVDFVEHIFRIVNNYHISTSLIQIEFTESIFLDDFQSLINIASELKYLGFKIALDDFGSAYSSLNYLKDLPFDIIKIDKSFLLSSSNTDKGRMIVAKIIELIKSLRLVPVMEGIETQEQASFLEKLSCDVGQGYFYARPMPQEDYITFLKTSSVIEDIDQYLKTVDQQENFLPLNEIPQEFQMDNWELYILGKNIDMGLMKGPLDQDASIQYINDRALEYLGYTRQEFREKLQNKITAFTHPDDMALVQNNIQELIRTGKPLKFQTRALRKDGKVIVLQGRSSSIIDTQGHIIGLHAFQDVTDDLERTMALKKSLEDKILELETVVASERKSREALRLSEERYSIIMEQSDDIMFDWDFATDILSLSDKYQKIFGRSISKEAFSTSQTVRDNIFPEDLPAFEEFVTKTFRHYYNGATEFRLLNKDGDYLWMRARYTVINDAHGNPLKAIGVFSNINKQKTELNFLKLKSQLDPLTHVLNKEEMYCRIKNWLITHPMKSGAFIIIDIDNFKTINDTLGHQFGDLVLCDITQKISKIFRATDIIGRLGGDEFSVFMHDFKNYNIVAKKAAQLVSTLNYTYTHENLKHKISVSIGVAYFPKHGIVFEDLYKNADKALYDSKHRNKNCYTIYNELEPI